MDGRTHILFFSLSEANCSSPLRGHTQHTQHTQHTHTLFCFLLYCCCCCCCCVVSCVKLAPPYSLLACLLSRSLGLSVLSSPAQAQGRMSPSLHRAAPPARALLLAGGGEMLAALRKSGHPFTAGLVFQLSKPINCRARGGKPGNKYKITTGQKKNACGKGGRKEGEEGREGGRKGSMG